jgi:hypothetical protein
MIYMLDKSRTIFRQQHNKLPLGPTTELDLHQVQWLFTTYRPSLKVLPLQEHLLFSTTALSLNGDSNSDHRSLSGSVFTPADMCQCRANAMKFISGKMEKIIRPNYLRVRRGPIHFTDAHRSADIGNLDAYA